MCWAKPLAGKQAESDRAEREQWETARAPSQNLERSTDLLVAAALLAAGYHRHDRGFWRKRKTNEPDRSTRKRTC